MRNNHRTSNSEKNAQSRRNLLRTTGLALGAGLTGLGTTVGAASAKGQISADMVKPGRPESVERFVIRTLELGETEDVIQAYRNLSDKQLQAVRSAYDRLSTYSIETSENAASDDVSTAALTASKTATYEKRVAGSLVHKTTHTLEFEFDLDTLWNPSNSSTGSAPAALWHHHGLLDSFLQVQNNSTEVYSTRMHEYTHSVGGEVIVHEAAIIDLQGFADGTIDVVRKTTSDL